MSKNSEYFTPEFKASFNEKWRKNKNGCHLWLKARDKDGYGMVSVGPSDRKGRIQRAHKVAYEMETGEDVPEGMDLDHTCVIRRCVNVDHLEVVPHEENMKRIKAEEDWAEDSMKESKTTPEEILEAAKEVLKNSNVAIYHRVALQLLNEAPWRELSVQEGRIPDGEYSRISLFFDCLRLGVPWRKAAEEILGVSAFTVKRWKHNPYFKEDFIEARKEGKKDRYEVLEERHLDAMERKIDDSDFDSIAKSLAKIREQDPQSRKAAAEIAAAGAPQIAIIVQGDTASVLKQIAETGDELEAEFEEV